MRTAIIRSAQQVTDSETQSHETWLQLVLLTCGYGLSVILLCTAISGPIGSLAGGLGAALGVWLYRWHGNQGLRNSVPAVTGIVFVLLGSICPGWLGRWWLVPYTIGISTTLVVIQSMTLAIISTGAVLLLRSLSRSTRALSMLDGLAIMAAICLRFAAHRNYHWGHPRFLADWAGIQGYELPMLFALIGLAALMAGLIAGMRQTNKQHAAISVITVLLLFGMLLWIGGRYLRNPTPELAESFGTPKIKAGSEATGNSNGLTPPGLETSNSEEPKNSSADGDSSDSAKNNGTGAASLTADSGSDSDTSSDRPKESGSSKTANDDPLPSAASQGTSPEPIALVLLEEDIQPIEKAWYFRQTAVSLFNGKRLVTASEAKFDSDIPSGFSNEEVLIGGIPLPENMHKIVPLVVNLIADQPRPFSLPSMIGFAPMVNPDPEFFRQRFHATSCVLKDETVGEESFGLYSALCYFAKGNSEWEESIFEHYTRSPDDTRYKELADSIVAERITGVRYEGLEDSSMLKALAIKRWLEKNTTYSLNPRFDDPSVNPAEQFLFGERHGYCVHIAHASVYLMRSLGIPSRIGCGYLVPAERSGKSSSILIQSTDAHAWPEIYLDGAGWVVVDASPEKIDSTTQRPPEPDPTVSQFLADKARNKDQHKPQNQERQYSRGFPLRLRHIPWIVLLVVAYIYCVKIWIRWAPSFASPPQLIRVTQRALILQLAEAGIQRHFGETRSEFGKRVASHYPEFTELTGYHVQQTYGRDVQLDRSCCLSFQKQTVERSRRTTNWFRRLIGLMDPRFWVLVR